MAIKATIIKKFNGVKPLGTLGAILYLFHKILHKFSRQWSIFYYQFYKMDMTASQKLYQKKPIYQFTWHSEYSADFDALPRGKEVIQDRFNQKAKCLLAKKGDEVVGCIWVGFSAFKEDECNCEYLIDDESVWDFDVYVFPKYRISRLFIYMWSKVSEDLEQKGFNYSYSRISGFNINSITTHTRLGALKVGGAAIVKLGILQITFSNIFPFFNITMFQQYFPRFLFRKK